MATTKNTQQKGVRTLKVYDKIFLRSSRYSRSHAVLYPEIRLIGKWLQDFGFMPGQHITVSTERNKLTITHSEVQGTEHFDRLSDHLSK